MVIDSTPLYTTHSIIKESSWLNFTGMSNFDLFNPNNVNSLFVVGNENKLSTTPLL